MKTINRKHSRLPWKVMKSDGDEYYFGHGSHENRIEDKKGNMIVVCGEEGDADVEFIVRACNSHEELLEALKSLVNKLEENRHGLDLGHGRITQAKQAIAKADGE